ncbi:MAG: membrane protein insertase YidC [Enterobacterales bacterium]|nr:membrane protein insertase YidC [Enterobacterales bacterium]
MESARTFLFITFAFLTFLLYQEWEKVHAPVKQPRPPIESSFDSLDTAVLPTTSNESSLNDEPVDIDSPQPEVINTVNTNIVNEQSISVETDTLKVLISTKGGNFVSAELKNYKESMDKGSLPINILENRSSRVFQAISGLFGKDGPNDNKQTAIYQAESNHYQLGPNQPELVVDLKWVSEHDVVFIKRFTFHRDSYVINVDYIVNNTSDQTLSHRMFTALKRDTLPADGQTSSGIGMRSYLGPAYSSDEKKYNKYDFDDLKDANLNIKTTKGWVAMLQHYFVTAWIPVSGSGYIIDSRTKAMAGTDLTLIRITGFSQKIAPGESAEFKSKLYVGPKIQDNLEDIADGLELTVDYGWLWWIGQPIFHLLTFFQSFVINWGLAIILVTISIKTLLYPLARAQYRSFAKMRLLQPKMTAMKEQFGDDRQKMSMKMMELYKKEKVNPLGGCLPLLVQMPVFISLYWVLMESVELRHAPFIFWITDLSVMDPFYVMPLMYGASMYLMQKMQPVSPTMDPMQQKMMQMMPLMMMVFFVFFPAGLVLYWLMNNLISIAQQLYVTKQFNLEQEQKKSKSKV